MAPTPRSHNPQNQPLTTLLRKICQDYPGGSGVLRELLQNADDAGASEIQFVLDTKSHPTSPLLAKGLDEYQGPALLVYNNSIFTETDWTSIASIGDSQKVRNKIATGKYGLGFNSIYNWTDSPSIISGDTLLLLDPHHSWSSKFIPPGGPNYDITADTNDEEMQNQLRAFSLVNTSWDKPLDGTIIRIPLRTSTCATNSKIMQTETTVTQIRDVLGTFAEEMGDFGLLFLKSIRRIVSKVDDVFQNIIAIKSDSDLSRPRMSLEDLVVRSPSIDGTGHKRKENSARKEIYHEVEVKQQTLTEISITRYCVLHIVGYEQIPTELMSWAEGQKLFPWVAVAARLEDRDDCDKQTGKLFSTLPLSITTNLKVHIHGLFSLSADRSRLHGLEDSGVQDKRPGEWNQFLFDSMIPEAWAILYSYMCCNHVEKSFEVFQSGSQSTTQLWYNINVKILEVVCAKHLKVFRSFGAYMDCKEAMFTDKSSDDTLVHGMKDLKLPAVVINAKDDKLHLLRTKLSDRFLSPKLLFREIRSFGGWDNQNEQTKLAFLEYLFQQIEAKKIGQLPIFPFEDGVYRSLITQKFMHRNNFEKRYFEKGKEVNLDTSRMSKDLCHAMHAATKNSMIVYRSANDICEYFFKYLFKCDNDVISPTKDIEDFVRQTWQWMNTHISKESDLMGLKSLWLLPLCSTKLRRLVPHGKSLDVTLFNGGTNSKLCRSLLEHDSSLADRVLSNHFFNKDILPKNLDLLLEWSSVPCYQLADGNNFYGLALFLKNSAFALNHLTNEEIGSCHRVLTDTYLALPQDQTKKAALKSIPIFPKVLWTAEAVPVRQLISVSGSRVFYGLRSLIPIPHLNEVIIDATNDKTHKLLSKTGILETLNEMAVLEKLVIPAAQKGLYDNMTSAHRLSIADEIFQNYYKLSSNSQMVVPKLRIVPLANTLEFSFGACDELIDPRKSEMKDLFFDDEVLWPDASFLASNSAMLKECGLMETLDQALSCQRIKVYANSLNHASIVGSKVSHMLSMELSGGQIVDPNLLHLQHLYAGYPQETYKETYLCAQPTNVEI